MCSLVCGIGPSAALTGLVDLVLNKAFYYIDEKGNTEEREIPTDLADVVEEYRDKLLEAVAETDEELMMKYLEGEELTEEEINSGIRKATIGVKIIPVCCGSSFKNKGVQRLLDAVIAYMPAPTDVPAIGGINPETDEEDERKSSDTEPFSALAFKIMTDPFVGRLTYFRVYSGVLKSGSYVYNSTKGKRERIGRILQMHANSRQEITEVHAGEIAAAVGLKDTTTGDTLSAKDTPIILESMVFPEPVIRVAIEPATKADQEKNGDCFIKVS